MHLVRNRNSFELIVIETMTSHQCISLLPFIVRVLLLLCHCLLFRYTSKANVSMWSYDDVRIHKITLICFVPYWSHSTKYKHYICWLLLFFSVRICHFCGCVFCWVVLNVRLSTRNHNFVVQCVMCSIRFDVVRFVYMRL